MPTQISSFDVSYRGREATEIMLDPIFMDETLMSEYKVMTNVVNSKKLQFAKKLEKIVRKWTGCGFNPVGGLDVYEREVTVGRMKVDLQLCIDEFLDTVFEELLKTGTRIHDASDTLIETILIARIQEAIKLDIQRIIWFSDPANPDPNYDQTDGLLTVHIPDLVTAGLIPYFNTGSGVPMVPGAGITALQTIYDNAPLPLKGLPTNQKIFKVSGSVYNQYREDIENGGGGDFGLTSMINGVETLMFRGVKITPQWRWDEIMNDDFASPDSHIVVYTALMNIVIATDTVNPGEDLFVWFDEREEFLKVKSRFKLGTNYVSPELFSVGF